MAISVGTGKLKATPCYISHGLPFDTLTIEILLDFLRYGPFFIEPLVAISHIRSRAQTLAAVYYNWLSMCMGGSTTPILMSYGCERKH